MATDSAPAPQHQQLSLSCVPYPPETLQDLMVNLNYGKFEQEDILCSVLQRLVSASSKQIETLVQNMWPSANTVNLLTTHQDDNTRRNTPRLDSEAVCIRSTQAFNTAIKIILPPIDPKNYGGPIHAFPRLLDGMRAFWTVSAVQDRAFTVLLQFLEVLKLRGAIPDILANNKRMAPSLHVLFPSRQKELGGGGSLYFQQPQNTLIKVFLGAIYKFFGYVGVIQPVLGTLAALSLEA